ncbi:GNAT family N-acetyltransferase [Candidatus Dependentiae bacterium]|nr:GNAT family N-acetyltransferase [Candidatus Dependentiae bacterium]
MSLTIELAKKSDIKDVFNLSNDFDVRANSFNIDKINWDDHVSWFENKIVSKDCVYFVVRNELKEFVGQIRFDKIAEEENSYIISISLHRSFRGKGLGVSLLQDCSSKLLNDFGASKIYAYIQENNKSSLKVFDKTGYKFIGKKICNNIKFFKFEYCRN